MTIEPQERPGDDPETDVADGSSYREDEDRVSETVDGSNYLVRGSD